MNTDPLHIIIYGIVFACVYVCGGGGGGNITLHYGAKNKQASTSVCPCHVFIIL